MFLFRSAAIPRVAYTVTVGHLASPTYKGDEDDAQKDALCAPVDERLSRRRLPQKRANSIYVSRQGRSVPTRPKGDRKA